MYVFTKRCVKYWLNRLRMQDNRFVKYGYLMLKCYSEASVSNWAGAIKQLLYSNGFGYVRERQSVAEERNLIRLL